MIILPGPGSASRPCPLKDDPEDRARDARWFGKPGSRRPCQEALTGPVVALWQLLWHCRSARASHASTAPTTKPTRLLEQGYTTLPARNSPRTHGTRDQTGTATGVTPRPGAGRQHRS